MDKNWKYKKPENHKKNHRVIITLAMVDDYGKRCCYL